MIKLTAQGQKKLLGGCDTCRESTIDRPDTFSEESPLAYFVLMIIFTKPLRQQRFAKSSKVEHQGYCRRPWMERHNNRIGISSTESDSLMEKITSAQEHVVCVLAKFSN